MKSKKGVDLSITPARLEKVPGCEDWPACLIADC